MDSEQPISEKDLGTNLRKELENITTGNNTRERGEANTPKIAKEIPIAEDIAEFRVTLEGKIFREGLSKSEWRRTYEETFAKYPRIKPYKELFDAVITNAEDSSNQLEEVWRYYQGLKKDLQEEDNPLVEQAEPQAAKELFRHIFDFDSEGEIDAIKGVITLRFNVDDDDFRKLRNLKDTEVISEGAVTTHPPGFKFPVLVLRKSFSQVDLFLHLAHELEHGKNRIIEEGRDELLRLGERLDMPKGIVDRLRRLKRLGWSDLTKTGGDFKDEILAYFTELEWTDPDTPTDTIKNNLPRWGEVLKDGLTNEQAYYPSYLSEVHKRQYEENVKRGVDSIVQLYDLYLSLGRGIRGTRMAINVLEQFPLNSWPAVVRLIKARHMQKTA